MSAKTFSTARAREENRVLPRPGGSRPLRVSAFLIGCLVSALFPKFVSAAADLFVQIDREDVLAGFGLRFSQFVEFCLGFGSGGNEGSLNGRSILGCTWGFRFGHDWVLLAIS